MCVGIFLFQSYLLKMELLTCPEPIVSNHGQEITCYSTMKFETCTQENISSISPTVGGCELGGLRSSSPSQGQVHRGAAEVNLDLTRGT